MKNLVFAVGMLSLMIFNLPAEATGVASRAARSNAFNRGFKAGQAKAAQKAAEQRAFKQGFRAGANAFNANCH